MIQTLLAFLLLFGSAARIDGLTEEEYQETLEEEEFLFEDFQKKD